MKQIAILRECVWIFNPATFQLNSASVYLDTTAQSAACVSQYSMHVHTHTHTHTHTLITHFFLFTYTASRYNEVTIDKSVYTIKRVFNPRLTMYSRIDVSPKLAGFIAHNSYISSSFVHWSLRKMN